MFNCSSLAKACFCLFVFLIVSFELDAQTRKMGKKDEAQPFMHMSFEAPLWISNPNTLDNSHKAGLGFRIDFPLAGGPWNFMTGFSHYNFGDHLNLLDRSEASNITGNEGSISYLTGTYALKYAGLPLGFRLEKKFWSTSFGYQLMFSLNQAEIHGPDTTFDFFGTEEFQDFSKEKINKVNSALYYSFAGKLPIGDRWSFYVEPQIEVLLKPVFKDGIDEVNRTNLYLKLGLRHLITLPSEE